MIFQESLGISIGEHQVSIVYLRGTLQGIKCAATSIFNLEKDVTLNQKLHAAGLAVKEFMQENNIGNASIYVGFPSGSAMFREIGFPAAVRQNLGTTLTYELDKYIPISMDEIYYDYQVTGEDGRNRITVLLMVVKRNELQHYLDFCQRIPGGANGIEIVSTAISNAMIYLLKKKTIPDLGEDFQKVLKGAKPSETSQAEKVSALMETFNLPSEEFVDAFGLALKGMRKVPVEMNLMPVEYRRRPNRTGYYAMIFLAGLVVLSFLGWVGSWWMHQKMVSRSLNVELKRLTAEMAEIKKIQDRVDFIEGHLSELNALNEKYVPVSDIVRELTQILPEGVWIQEFNLDKNKIQIQGYADSASDLISFLEASPLFKDVYFASAIVKEKDARERFNISLELESS